MSLFNKLTSDGLEQSVDRLGGFAPLDSDIYIATIKALYAGVSSNGATSITLLADLGGNREYRETMYVTNRNGENFFKDKQSGKKVPLPGFVVVDDLCLVATGEPLAAQETEEKVINIYDFDQKKDMPKAVPMIMAAVGQKVALGIVKQTVNKSEKSGDEYVPTAETKEENVIEKIFHPEHKVTVAEARNGQTEGKFWDAWVQRNQGQTKDKRKLKGDQGGSAAAPKAGTKPAPTAGQPARKSLFGK